MIKIGDIEIHLINDCRVMVDGGGAFGLVPRILWQRYFKPTDDNMIPMNQTCLFVRANGKNIIVDTGLGTKLNDKVRRIFRIEAEGGLLTGLAKLGVLPEEIDLVIDTHLHSDHAGGNTKFVEGSTDEVEATFPNAEYVVQRREYEDAMQPNERTAATYFPFNYQPLVESGQMRLLDGDEELLPGITGIVTPGHTPAHMSIRFESKGEHAAFLCDLASYAVHFERIAWMTAYDVEPLRTLETKRIWQQWALDNDAIVIFPHDVKRPIGRLTQTERGAIIVEAIDEPYVNE
ncbi:MAG: MBL fold metallo-hydrolase [Anaerolineae bacterium]|nr:MBL fold metallo-hydrolase [Anaerolineae bacterium]MDQ7034962.1 MBL fold metallo-hydrolase [Anaerolineae bacterium]